MISTLRQFKKVYRHAGRYREIIHVLVKHGFGELISKANFELLPFRSKLKTRPKSAPDIENLTIWERIKLVLEELGPTFIKFGQIMSNRPDLVSPELVLELEKLQDSVQPFPSREAVAIIESTLKQPLDRVFRKFDTTPIAAASIAQIHKGILITGEEVAVKIQRPNIKKQIQIDIEIMIDLANALEKYVPELKIINLNGIIREFDRAITKELDFENEAMNMERFREMFKDDPGVKIPELFHEYSTESIVVMEFIHGIKITDIEKIKESNLSPELLASRGADIALKQIFDFGFFHADPHPGNLLVLENNVICYLDYGMMGVLSQASKEHLVSVILGVVNREPRKIVRNLLRFSQSENEINVMELEERVNDLLYRHAYKSLDRVNAVAIFNDMLSLFIDYKLRMPSDFYLLLRAITISQNTGVKLNPNFDIVEHLEPYARKFVRKQFNPLKIGKDIGLTAVNTLSLLQDLPDEVRDITSLLKKGKIKVDIEHRGLDKAIHSHEQISNRIAFSIIVAAMIIGSSLVVLSKLPPLVYDMPLIGFIGFVSSGILGIWLLISIIRHGRM